MLRGVVDGPSLDDAVARLTHERIRALAAQLPTVYLVELVSCERPSEFAFRTTSGPTPFGYHFRFTPAGGATLIQIEAEADLGSAADLLAPLARRAVKKGVDENLATLKTILEIGGERQE